MSLPLLKKLSVAVYSLLVGLVVCLVMRIQSDWQVHKAVEAAKLIPPVQPPALPAIPAMPTIKAP